MNTASPLITMPAAFCGATPLAIFGDALAELVASWNNRAQVRPAAPVAVVEGKGANVMPFTLTNDGTAIISLSGPMLGAADPFLDWLGVDYTVTPRLTDAILQANANPAVKNIVINADSPGGEVTGLQAAHDAVANASKPVMVAASGLLCSAAYYVAAAADSIIADPTTIVGSIGTMTTMTDVSALLAKMGIAVHLIASGPQKGTGTPGVPLTDERKRPMQAIVDGLAAQFRAAVTAGRGLDAAAVEQLATGEAWLASRAAELGLIDSISTNPLAAASTNAKEATMLTKDQLKALLAAHPDHRTLIVELDDAGKDEGDVKAAIIDASHQADRARVIALEADLATAKVSAATALKTEQDAHAATKADLSAKLTAMTDKHDRLAKLAPNHRDPGAGDLPEAHAANKPLPITQAAFDEMTQPARAAFMKAGGTLG